MDNDSMKKEIKGRLAEYVNTLSEHRMGSFFNCPLCGSGTGPDGSPAFSIDPNRDNEAWHCFACGKDGDIFSLIGEVENLPDFKDQFNRACDVLGITHGNGPRSHDKAVDRGNTKAGPKVAQNGQERPLNAKAEKPIDPKEIENAKKYLEACADHTGNTDYFSKRGLSAETVKRFGLGYDPNLYDPKAGQIVPAITIPYGENIPYYVQRTIDYKQYLKPKTAKLGREVYVFNEPSLYNRSKPVFICEGPFDAMSIEQEGGHAVAVVTTGAPTNLKEALKRLVGSAPSGHEGGKPWGSSFIIAMDNDEQGNNGADRVKQYLKELKLNFIVARWETPGKDANEMLVNDPESFRRDIQQNLARAYEMMEAKQLEALEEVNRDSGARRAEDLIKWIKENMSAEPLEIPTGFKNLDEALNGGLYPGLYILGAVSSLGKTTLALQIADNIAKQGRDVMVISLEMGAQELIGRSISRLTFSMNREAPDNVPKTYRGVMTPRFYSDYNSDQVEAIDRAFKEYMSFASRIYFKEGLGDYSVSTLWEDVQKHKELTGNTPVIVVDYLQILAPEESVLRASDKQITDKAVLELKRLSRDYGTPVLAISSFNRDNYAQAVSMSSFKESGAIEYGSDVLIALQPEGIKQAGSDKEKANNKEKIDRCKSSEVRDLEAVILKNRNGKTGGRIAMRYNAMFNHFEERDFSFNGWKPAEESDGSETTKAQRILI